MEKTGFPLTSGRAYTIEPRGTALPASSAVTVVRCTTSTLDLVINRMWTRVSKDFGRGNDSDWSMAMITDGIGGFF